MKEIIKDVNIVIAELEQKLERLKHARELLIENYAPLAINKVKSALKVKSANRDKRIKLRPMTKSGTLREKVTNYIAEHGPVKISAVAAATGLAAIQVSNILRNYRKAFDLTAEGWIVKK